MKNFSFNLQPVLTYRKLVEEREQQKLYVIHSSIQKAQQVQATLRAEITRYSRTLAAQTHETIDVFLMKNLASYLDKLQADALKVAHVISKLEDDRRVQVDKLVKARKAREVVEKLKEKNLAIYEKGMLAMEQKLLDEVSAVRFARSYEQLLPADESD